MCITGLSLRYLATWNVDDSATCVPRSSIDMGMPPAMLLSFVIRRARSADDNLGWWMASAGLHVPRNRAIREESRVFRLREWSRTWRFDGYCGWDGWALTRST